MLELVLNLPLRIQKTKRKVTWFYLNLNIYRNAPFQQLNNMKVAFAELVQDQIRDLPAFEWVTFKYILFPGSARDMDTNNVCSIVDKFFCDAFVSAGKLEDDNYRFLRGTEFLPGEIDRDNPRVELHITGKIKEPEEMQIKVELDNQDFYNALEQYVRSKMDVPEGKKVEFNITAGRGDKGYTAEVIFADQDEPEIASKLRQVGNSVNRAGTDPMPKTMTPATSQELRPEKAQEAPKAVEQSPAPTLAEKAPERPAEPAPQAMSGASMGQAEPKVDSLFNKGETVEDTTAEDVDDKPAQEEPVNQKEEGGAAKPRPLFNFGS